MEIKIMVSKGDDVIAHVTHEPQLKGFIEERCVKESAHAEIAGVNQEEAVSMKVALFPNKISQLCVPALFPFLPVFHSDTVRKKMGMHIMGKENDELSVGASLTCQAICERKGKEKTTGEQGGFFKPTHGHTELPWKIFRRVEDTDLYLFYENVMRGCF
jgi:hypothetical protein